MQKIIFNNTIDSGKIDRAAEILNNNGILIHPTENLYGLGAKLDAAETIKKIGEIKQRTSNKGFIILIGSKKQLEKHASSISPQKRKLMDKYWPGALTIIFPAKKQFHDHPACLENTFAIRLVGNSITRKIIKNCGCPIISTSINISGNKIINDPQEIINKFSNKVEGFVIDEIHNFSTKPSTIVKEKNNKIKILRQGILKL
ncbi:MAG: threonylcarbamoyl-AMP synthase [Candidatus Cloacimonetes bacterium]|nr:threonylcarbamoyl-AMP synthase [Candidatus Cloacimonadota bacterium]